MKDSLLYQAARHALGARDADAIKKTIDILMNDGFYDDTCLDALDSSPARMDEVLPAFHAALDHYGVVLPSPEQAVCYLIEYHLRRIASGTSEPLQGLCQLLTDTWNYDLYTPTKKSLGDSHGISELIGLYWGGDDLVVRPDEVSFNGKYGEEALAEVEREIRFEAERWLVKNAR
jgi:hypothetical protein